MAILRDPEIPESPEAVLLVESTYGTASTLHVRDEEQLAAVVNAWCSAREDFWFLASLWSAPRSSFSPSTG